MSLILMSRVWRTEGIDPMQKLVLLKLADNASDEGECYPFVATIVKHTGLHRSTVFRHLESLEATGWITRAKQQNRTSTLYVLHPEKWGVAQRDPSHNATPPSHSATPPVAQRDARYIDEQSKEPSSTIMEDDLLFGQEKTAKGGADPTDSAEQIYQAYPRKVGKAAALKAIRAALKKHKIKAPELLAAVENYALSRKGKDHKFTPHPATWFTQERWEDQIQIRTDNDSTTEKPWLWGDDNDATAV